MKTTNYYSVKSRKSLEEKVFLTIKKAILVGLYKPGERLVEEKIARELQISRTPVREAIKKLEIAGLVVNYYNQGALVKGLSIKEIKEICFVRSLLETAAVEMAAKEATENTLNELCQIEQSMNNYMLEERFNDFAKCNRRFHEIINIASGNERLFITIQSLGELLSLVWDAIPSNLQNARDSFNEHKLILQAIKQRDSHAAGEYMKKHICSVEAKILKKMEEGEIWSEDKLKLIFDRGFS